MYNDKHHLQEERYKLLINARNFHYDNFNKWMTFFYVAIGALFVGYYNILDKEDYFFQEIIIIIAGLIISIFWHWSCKGYYYWVTQFIKLIMEYEKSLPIELRIYSCMANKKLNNNYFHPLKGANISTSKITLLFSLFIILIWYIILIKSIFDKLEYTHICCNILFVILSLIVIYIIISTVSQFIKSDISKHDDLNLE